MKTIQEQSEEIYKRYAESNDLATSNFNNAMAPARKAFEEARKAFDEILSPLKEIHYEAQRQAHKTLTTACKELQDRVDLTTIKVVAGKRYRLEE